LRKWISAGVALPRIGESADRVRRVDVGADGSVGGFALVEPGLDDVVEDGAAYADGVAAVAVRIPDQAHARRKIGLLGIPHGVRNSGVALEEETGGRVRVHFAELAGVESGGAERIAAAVLVRIGEHGLPAESVIQSEVFGNAEGVLSVETCDPGAQIVRRGV